MTARLWRWLFQASIIKRQSTTKDPKVPALFPYTTLFRSPLGRARRELLHRRDPLLPEGELQLPELGFALGEERGAAVRAEEHTSELQSQFHFVFRLLLQKKDIVASANRFLTSKQIGEKYA